MSRPSNIVIADESALNVYMHIDCQEAMGFERVRKSPLETCAASTEDQTAFNVDNPLYGGKPVTVLLGEARLRRKNPEIKGRLCTQSLPERSFLKIRKGLFITSPELTFIRMARHATVAQLAEIGMGLCSRYYISLKDGEVLDRSRYVTNPRLLRAYADKVPSACGASKSTTALRWLLGNSGSPYESKMTLLFKMPMSKGGFFLDFDQMNFDVQAGRMAQITDQGSFCIDLVNADMHIGLEYDGESSHPDSSKDKQRRNALAAMGWRVFPIEKSVLHDCELTIKAAHQVARAMGKRMQFPRSWEQNYVKLRKELGLPA